VTERPWHACYPPGLPARGTYPETSLWGVLEETSRARPCAVAVIDGDARITYGALRQRALRVAGGLAEDGVEPGDRVVLRLGNSEDFVAAYFGILAAGAIAVPMPLDLGPAEREAREREVAPRLILDPGERIPESDPIDPRPGPLAVLQFTSGTTGHPRAAEMTHANLVANALQNARWFGWREDEVVLGVLPLHHTWGLCVGLNSTIACGGTLALADMFDTDLVFGLVDRHRATILYGSATMFHRLADAAPRHPDGLASLRLVKAGAMLSQGGLKARWDALFPHAPLQQGYGLTEASPETHDNPPHRHRAGTVGVPIQDTDCRIVDAEDPGRVLPAGEAGEVCIRGPQVTRGYWNRPDETAAAFHDGWLLTGDIGTMDHEGYLTIVDRKKDMLKFRGFTLTPAVIEEALLEHPAVREAVVVGRRDERDGEVPIACVVLEGETEDEALRAFCAERLGRHEVPRGFERVPTIPRNRVGKPLRRSLRDLVNDAPDR